MCKLLKKSYMLSIKYVSPIAGGIPNQSKFQFVNHKLFQYTLNQRAFKFILMTEGRRKQSKAGWAKMKLVYYAPRLSWSKPGWAASARSHPLPASLVTHICTCVIYSILLMLKTGLLNLSTSLNQSLLAFQMDPELILWTNQRVRDCSKAAPKKDKRRKSDLGLK